ncbi:PREDICTED: uncharacterized protein LOC109171848 [Ipomoea nil]|uniref:uncharacterized protein LOC109171848 n=1 Tax=Ipomoea nil TaxID=35883 RepID=UPI000900BCE2|nr:PREDICTED: uncharacterized protein LOC109171848 [Ipomoea nil]
MKNPRRRANDDHDKQQPSETKRLLLAIVFGTMFGYLIGASSFPGLSTTRVIPAPTLQLNVNGSVNVNSTTESRDKTPNQTAAMDPRKIWAPSNPRGAELLPPKLVVSESDFFPRRLWGLPSEDLPFRPKYLVTFTVGYNQKNNIDAAVKKFSENFTILLFHYDGRTTEWNEFEWSKRAIHVSVPKQTKWWFAKRFLHPDIVAAYEYIFMWDEDLGVENFNAEEYIKLVKKHGLEISQPALEPKEGYWINWEMTKRKSGHEVHKVTEEKPGWCNDPLLPPCAGFVEVMVPVFSRDAWRCAWRMVQNDLVHGWGLDLKFQRCVEPAHEKIGVVDAQPVVHKRIPTLKDDEINETPKNGVPLQASNDSISSQRSEIHKRGFLEWAMFEYRFADADEAYYKSIGRDSPFQSQTSLESSV